MGVGSLFEGPTSYTIPISWNSQRFRRDSLIGVHVGGSLTHLTELWLVAIHAQLACALYQRIGAGPQCALIEVQ